MIDSEFDHCVSITLHHRDIWDPQGRMIEVTRIRSWLDELVEWQPNQYQIQPLLSTHRLNVWFRHEQHAVACAIKYL